MNKKHRRLWREQINTDHRYWFSPHTIAKVMVRAGIRPEEVLFVDQYNYWPKRVACWKQYIKKPYEKDSVMSDSLLCVGTYGQKDYKAM